MPSLTPTILRLGAVEALCPTASKAPGGPPFPTIAGREIADSAMVPVDKVLPGAPKRPMVAVYTEVVQGKTRGDHQHSQPSDLFIDLVVEAQLSVHEVFGEVEHFRPAESDAEAEAALDFLTAQIRRTIVRASTNGGLLHRIIRRIDEVESWPLRLPELGDRMARRTLRLRLEADDDTWNADGGLPKLGVLLRSRLPDTSYAARILDRLGAAIGAEDPADALAVIRFGINVGQASPETPESGAIGGRVSF